MYVLIQSGLKLLADTYKQKSFLNIKILCFNTSLAKFWLYTATATLEFQKYVVNSLGLYQPYISIYSITNIKYHLHKAITKDPEIVLSHFNLSLKGFIFWAYVIVFFRTMIIWEIYSRQLTVNYAITFLIHLTDHMTYIAQQRQMKKSKKMLFNRLLNEKVRFLMATISLWHGYWSQRIVYCVTYLPFPPIIFVSYV